MPELKLAKLPDRTPIKLAITVTPDRVRQFPINVRIPGWAREEPNIHYHDTEWGVPQHDDRVLFEFLILEGAQAGLSWTTILNKRENYRRAH